MGLFTAINERVAWLGQSSGQESLACRLKNQRFKLRNAVNIRQDSETETPMTAVALT
jgi:hypothetical protein